MMNIGAAALNYENETDCQWIDLAFSSEETKQTGQQTGFHQIVKTWYKEDKHTHNRKNVCSHAQRKTISGDSKNCNGNIMSQSDAPKQTLLQDQIFESNKPKMKLLDGSVGNVSV